MGVSVTEPKIQPRVAREHPLLTAARPLVEAVLQEGRPLLAGTIIIEVAMGAPAEIKVRSHEKSLARRFGVGSKVE
jgi:hypothetical protein